MTFFNIILGEYATQGETLYKFVRAFMEKNYDHEDAEDLGEMVNEIAFAYMCRDYLQLTTDIEWDDTFDKLLTHERIIKNKQELVDVAFPIVADYDIEFGDGLWDLVQFTQYYFKEDMLKYFKDEKLALRVMDSLLFIDRYANYPKRNQVTVSDHFFDKYINHYE